MYQPNICTSTTMYIVSTSQSQISLKVSYMNTHCSYRVVYVYLSALSFNCRVKRKKKSTIIKKVMIKNITCYPIKLEDG